MFSRIEDGCKFRRSIFGYSTQRGAVRAAKDLWHFGHAVRVEQVGRRWHVWRSV